MRTIVLAAATAATLSLGAVTANAAPLIFAAPAAGAPVVLVAGGCGTAFHRGPYGRCFANGVVRRILPLYRGVCVRRWTAFGWRRVCR